jgi:hypothetical protein
MPATQGQRWANEWTCERLLLRQQSPIDCYATAELHDMPEAPWPEFPMTAAPSSSSVITIDPRISAIASGIAAAIPEVQVRLFGARARGTARPDSDVDLLITVPDHWLAGRDRVRVLGALWRQYSTHRIPTGVHAPCRGTHRVVSQRCQEMSAAAIAGLPYQLQGPSVTG